MQSMQDSRSGPALLSIPDARTMVQEWAPDQHVSVPTGNDKA